MFKIDEETWNKFHNLALEVQDFQNFAGELVSTGETRDFYHGFASGLSLAINVFAIRMDLGRREEERTEDFITKRADFVGTIAALIGKAKDCYDQVGAPAQE